MAVVTDVERDGFPVVGFGFNSNGRYAASGILKERFIPRLLEAEDSAVANDGNTNLDPHKCWDIMMSGEKPGGHGERSVACGVLDMALWDAVAKIEDKPLCAVLAERYGCKADGLVGYVGPSVPMERVWVYAAGGYYQPEKDHTKLQEEMQGYLDMGFKTVKMKIGGAPLEEDIERIKAVRRKHLIILLIVVLSQSWQICFKKNSNKTAAAFVSQVLEITGGGGETLAVDANGRFDLETAKAYGQAMAPFNLKWYEEAGDPLDYQLQKELSADYPATHAMATGENLFSMQDARNLIRYGGMHPGTVRKRLFYPVPTRFWKRDGRFTKTGSGQTQKGASTQTKDIHRLSRTSCSSTRLCPTALSSTCPEKYTRPLCHPHPPNCPCIWICFKTTQTH